MAGETLNSTQRVKTLRNWKITITTWAGWVFVALGFLSAYPAYSQFRSKPLTLETFSQFGSYLQGAVASLFSLGGLLFIYASFLGQQKQINQQEQDQKDQREQFKAQQDSIKRQNFESSFFQLLGLHRENVKALWTVGYPKSGGLTALKPMPIQGKECFQEFYRCLKATYEAHKEQVRRIGGVTAPPAPDCERKAAANIYVDLSSEHHQQLSHYFRTLYHVIKFVKESELGNKRRYTSLMRAQLSPLELALLFYRCLNPDGAGFKSMIEEFGLLEHLDESLLLDKSHKDFYALSAYK